VFSKKTTPNVSHHLKVVEGVKTKGSRGISMLGDGCSFQGKMFLQGESRVGGKVTGSVYSDGFLTLETSAHVEGEVIGSSVHLNGTVIGNIVAKELLIVSATAKIQGELQAKRLIVEDGGTIEGKITPFVKEPDTSVKKAG
jgi:cytoskeletal protein CcmA (bactofilin family)